jgi:succinate dehydrogenase / fumarate reductase, cytochrome b subunit
MGASIQNPDFLLRRLHSLLGLLPVGAFLLFHLWENSLSRRGEYHYNKYVVEKIQDMNYVWLLEIFVIALPITFHALYGW